MISEKCTSDVVFITEKHRKIRENYLLLRSIIEKLLKPLFRQKTKLKKATGKCFKVIKLSGKGHTFK